MNIPYCVTGNSDSQSAVPVLLSVLAALVLYGLLLPACAADLGIRIYEREGKSPLQDVSVCLGTPANISQFGAALTGPDGLASFRDVPRAPLVVTASKPGYRAAQQSLVTTNTDRLLILSLPTGGGGPVCKADNGRNGTGNGGLRVSQFRISKGIAVTTTPNVFLNHKVEGVPTQYRASEHPDFTGSDWQTYTTTPGFKLSAGNGRKVVYFQVRRSTTMNGADIEVFSPVVQDAITLQHR